MGNAPAPQVFTDNYNNFQLTFISEEETAVGRFEQHFNLENRGSGYISRVYLENNSNLEFYGSYQSDYSLNTPFEHCLFEPGYDGEIVLTSSSKMPDVKKIKPKAEGYSNFVKDMVFEGTKEVSMLSKSNSSSSDYWCYTIDLAINVPDEHYNYGAIAKLNYKDVVSYICVSHDLNYRFYTHEELELDKLTVEEVIGVKSEPYLTHQLGGCFGDMSNLITLALVVFFLFALVLSFGIFAAIFFPAMGRITVKLCFYS